MLSCGHHTRLAHRQLQVRATQEFVHVLVFGCPPVFRMPQVWDFLHASSCFVPTWYLTASLPPLPTTTLPVPLRRVPPMVYTPRHSKAKNRGVQQHHLLSSSEAKQNGMYALLQIAAATRRHSQVQRIRDQHRGRFLPHCLHISGGCCPSGHGNPSAPAGL